MNSKERSLALYPNFLPYRQEKLKNTIAKFDEKGDENLKKVRKIIDVPEPIAINKDFNYALVSKYMPDRLLFGYFKQERA
jgi:hypothetical protein